MERNNKTTWIIILIGLLVGTLFLARMEVNNLHNKIETKDNLLQAINDTLKIIRNKDSSTTAKITAFETKSKQDFLKLQSNDETIKDLQLLVNKYKSKLDAGSLATKFTSNTNINTTNPTIISKTDTLYLDNKVYLYPEYKSNINMSNWITGTSIANRDSTKLNLLIKDEYDVVIGEDDGLFKKRKPFAEVTSHNPYSEVQTLRTYRVKVPEPKRMGLGLHIGYGFQLERQPKWYPLISVGVNFNLIEF